MATQVTKSNLFSEARTNIKDLINTRTNVADPTRGNSEFRKFIYSREPDIKSSDFSGFPYIIIHPSNLDMEKLGSVNLKKKFVNWMIEIEVITSDRGHGSVDGKGLTYMDTICDDIVETLSNVTNRQTLIGNTLHFVTITSGSVSTGVSNNTLVYRRSFFIGMRTRMVVSS